MATFHNRVCRFGCRLGGAVALLGLALGQASAFGPRDALAYRGAELPAAAARISATLAQQRATGYGTSGVVASTYRNQTSQYATRNEAYTLNLSYLHDPVALMDAKRSVAAAKRDLVGTTRDGVQQALLAHAALWQAQADHTSALAKLEIARLTCAEAERKLALGGVSALDVEIARVDGEDAELALQQAAQALATAQAEARRLKLQGDAEPGSMHFALPVPQVAAAPVVEDSLWELKLALARHKQAKRDVMPGIGVNASYLGDTQLQANLSTRGPRANLNMGYPTLYDASMLLYGQGWQFGLSLELPIDFAARARVRATRAEVELADARLDTRRQEMTVKCARLRDAAQAAEAGLGLADKRRALTERKYRAIKAKAEAGAASALAVLEADQQRAEADAQAARAWQAYVEAVGSYLELMNGTWEEQP